MFVVNNKERIYKMKFIDICGFKKLELSEFDEGVTQGLTSLIKFLEDIRQEK